MTERPMTVTEHNEQLVIEKTQLLQRLQIMQRGVAILASFAADEKDAVRVPKQAVANDVHDVTWKTLKAGSIVFKVHRTPDE